MKKSKLNRFNIQKSRRSILAKLSLLTTAVFLSPFQTASTNNPVIARLAEWEDLNKHFLLIKEKLVNQNVVDVYPCGEDFAIAIEDDRFYFCRDSSQIYTAPPPTSSSKVNLPNEINLQEEVYKRVNELNVFSYQGNHGQKWGIDTEQLKESYPSSTMDIFLDGENKTAFNPENLIYEMLISIQKLSQENTALKLRLDELEKSKNGYSQNISELASFKILENPSTSNTLRIEYNIDSKILNASVQIVSITGTKLCAFPIHQRGSHIEQFIIDLPPNTYLCVLIANQQITNTQKFIVQ